MMPSTLFHLLAVCIWPRKRSRLNSNPPKISRQTPAAICVHSNWWTSSIWFPQLVVKNLGEVFLPGRRVIAEAAVLRCA
jgi:hypothetical protein